jgi:hypothetical protein
MIARLNKRFDRRFVYVMYSPEYKKIKIGISKNVEVRRDDIDKDVKGDVKVLSAKLFWNAEKNEKFLHSIFDYWHSPMKQKGTGYTEWFSFSILLRWMPMFALWLLHKWQQASILIWVLAGFCAAWIFRSEMLEIIKIIANL